MQEFRRDTRGLIFLDTTVVSEAFLHHETRRLDNAGCFSINVMLLLKLIFHRQDSQDILKKLLERKKPETP